MVIEIPDFWTGVPPAVWWALGVFAYLLGGVLTGRLFVSRRWGPLSGGCYGGGPDDDEVMFFGGMVVVTWPVWLAGVAVWFWVLRPLGWALTVGTKSR